MTPTAPFKAFKTNEEEPYSSSALLSDRMAEHLMRLSGSWAEGAEELATETIGTLQNRSTLARESSLIPTRIATLNQALSQSKSDRLNFLSKAVGRVTTEAAVPADRATGMQKWEGRILEVDTEYFSADLAPFEGGEQVIADFPRELLPDEEINAGDVIYVTVRTIAARGGPTRTSAVRLRRLGTWTEAEVAEHSRLAKEDEAELAKYFD